MLLKPKQTATTTLLKDGTYRAKLTDVKAFTNSYGERLGFQFTIDGGPYDGSKVLRSTATQLSKQSKLAEVLEGIAGRPLTHDELSKGFDVDQLIGKECSILVLQSKSKTGQTYSNVERVFQS